LKVEVRRLKSTPELQPPTFKLQTIKTAASAVVLIITKPHRIALKKIAARSRRVETRYTLAATPMLVVSAIRWGVGVIKDALL
jgi:hypothetical protein